MGMTERKNEYGNLFKLVRLIFSTSSSNSQVEWGFSLLTMLLSDRRLKMHHDTIEAIMLVKLNHDVWSEQEQEEILRDATVHYTS